MTKTPAIIKRDRVQLETVRRVPASPRPRPGAAADEGGACEKRARTVESDGRVVAIEVTCSCGEATVVRLEYPSDAPEARTA